MGKINTIQCIKVCACIRKDANKKVARSYCKAQSSCLSGNGPSLLIKEGRDKSEWHKITQVKWSIDGDQALRLRRYCYRLLKTPWRTIANNPGARRSCKGFYRESSLECSTIIGNMNSHWYPIIVPICCLETHVNLQAKVAYRACVYLPMR